MKTLRVLLLLVSAAVLQGTVASAAQCDCNHFPWDPESCVDVCGALVLKQATESELQAFLHLEPSTARRVTALKASATEVTSLKQVESSLSQREYQTILQSLKNLDPLAAQYLVKTPEEKRIFLDKIKATYPN